MTPQTQNRLFYPPPVTPAELAKAKHYIDYVCARFRIVRQDTLAVWNYYLPVGDRLLERRWRNWRPHGPYSKPWLYTKPVIDKAAARRNLRAIHDILDKYQVPRDLRPEFLKAYFKSVAMSIYRGIAELEAQGYLGGALERH